VRARYLVEQGSPAENIKLLFSGSDPRGVANCAARRSRLWFRPAFIPVRYGVALLVLWTTRTCNVCVLLPPCAARVTAFSLLKQLIAHFVHRARRYKSMSF
jgi:hypothetical protein